MTIQVYVIYKYFYMIILIHLGHECYLIVLFQQVIDLFIAVNIEDTAPILKKVEELPKPEPVRVGDADKLKQAGKFYSYSPYHLLK